MTKAILTAAVAACIFLLQALLVDAVSVPVKLDPSFGNNGTTIVDVAGGAPEDEPFLLVMQPDGKLLTPGKAYNAATGEYDFVVLRYNPDGSLDQSFGGTGKVLTDFRGDHDEGLSLALQDDGKIVVAGVARNPSVGTGDFALARYNADGSLDTGFGWGGLVITDFIGGADQALSVVIQPDGKIVAGGFATGSTTGFDFALARYLPSGALDHSFGWAGLVMLDFDKNTDGIMKLAIQGDNIIAAGMAYNASNESLDFALARFSSSGALDTTFGGGSGKPGTTRTDFFGGTDVGFAMLVLPDDKVVVGGLALSTITGHYDLALARYTVDGVLDQTFATFGAPGVLSYDVFGSYDQILALALQPDGKIVAAGHAFHPSRHFDFLVARFNADGTPDYSFGYGGLFTMDFFGGPDGLHGVVTTTDGKIIAAGDIANPGTGGDDFANVSLLAADPSWIRAVVNQLSLSAFAIGGSAAVLSQLDAIESALAANDVSGALSAAQDLRSRLDGCAGGSSGDDWIIDCQAQEQIRVLVDQVIYKLGG